MVPKQCPLLRPTFWYLICCATCLGSRDNSKYHTIPRQATTQIPTSDDRDRIFIDCSTLASRLRRSASAELVIAYVTWFRRRQCRLSFLRHCLSSELRVGCCQYSRAFLLWALLILAFSRAASSLEVAPSDIVPKQCPFRRPTIWYLVCCATCLGPPDNPNTIPTLLRASAKREASSYWYTLKSEYERPAGRGHAFERLISLEP